MQELLRMLQHARLAASATHAAGALPAPAPTSAAAEPAALAAVVQAIGLLSGALATCAVSAAEDSSVQARAAALAGLARLSVPSIPAASSDTAPSSSTAAVNASQQEGASDGALPSLELQAALELQRRLMQRRQQQQQQQQQQGQQRQQQRQEQQGEQGPRKRWRRTASWRPCAIGCLPSVHDLNGALSQLDLPEQQAPPAGTATMEGMVESRAPGGEHADCQPADARTVAVAAAGTSAAAMQNGGAGQGYAAPLAVHNLADNGRAVMDALHGVEQHVDGSMPEKHMLDGGHGAPEFEQAGVVVGASTGAATSADAGVLCLGGWMLPDTDAARLASSVQLLL